MDFSLSIITSHKVWAAGDLHSTVVDPNRKGFASLADRNPAADSSEASCNRSLGCSLSCIDLFCKTLSET